MSAAGFHRTPAAAPLGIRGRLALAAEILLDYGPAWRTLRTDDLPHMVRAARAVESAGARPAAADEHALAVRLGAVVGRMLAVLPTDSRCLIRSLVLTRMLSRRSIPSALVIGVQPPPRFSAHAWVEHDGRAVLPPGRFGRLLEL